MKIKIVIIDDEEDAVSCIKQMIESYTEDTEVCGVAYSAMDGIKVINLVKPHIVFLDVQMPKVDGLEMLESFTSRTFETILTTASASHSFQAIKLNVVDYLLKPIIVSELQAAIEKCKTRLRLSAPSDTIVLADQSGYTIVKLKDIIFIKGEGNYTTFFLKSNQKIVTSKNLKHFEDIISERYLVRCHQSYMVNTKEVINLRKDDGWYLIMSTGDRIDVSRANKEKIFNILGPSV